MKSAFLSWTRFRTLVLEVRLPILYDILPVLEGLEDSLGYESGGRMNAKLVDNPYMAD
jgi:hypothetical protein